MVIALALSAAHCGRTPMRGEETTPWSDAADTRDVSDATLPRNACGGTAVLAAVPDDACGPCARWACEGTDSLACRAFAMVNACGTCGAVPDEECNGRDDNCDGRIDEGCVRRLTTLRENAAHPRLSGERVAFDVRGRSSNASDAAMATVPEGIAQILSPHSDPPGLTTDPSQESETTIGGDLVVWITRRVDPLWNGGRVMALDLASGRTITVSDRRSNHPSVDGATGRVVFESPGATDYEWDLWEWTASDGVARAITGREGDEHEPEISGDRLVFTRGTGVSPLFNREIVVRDLRDGSERVLSTGLEGFQTEPAIDGERVVWRQQMGSSAPSRVGILWLFDLATGVRRRIDEGGVAYDPRISGGLVCWSTLSGEAGGLTVLDLATGRARVLSREGHHCDVEARRIVWLEGSSAVDVFWRDLLPGEP